MEKLMGTFETFFRSTLQTVFYCADCANCVALAGGARRLEPLDHPVQNRATDMVDRACDWLSTVARARPEVKRTIGPDENYVTKLRPEKLARYPDKIRQQRVECAHLDHLTRDVEQLLQVMIIRHRSSSR